MKTLLKCLAIWMIGFFGSSFLEAQQLLLKENLQYAQPGDYLISSARRTLTLLHIYGKQDNLLTLEEISVPERRRPIKMGWKQWVANHAPGHTNWVMYEVDLRTGQILRYYSFTKNNWFEIPEADNFLSKLLNLNFRKIPDEARKKIGCRPRSGPDLRQNWQPHLLIEGQMVQGVAFDAWRTQWPRDGGDLSGKVIEVYLPQDNQRYPSYFPYWLEIHGMVGKAKVRIVDSGTHLHSPKPSLNHL